MKLLSIERAGNTFIGYVEDGHDYKSFEVHEDGTVVFDQAFPKKRFKNYEHFAGVIGKFDPYAFFFEKPIEIERLDYSELSKLKEVK